jgi:membrane protein
MSQESATACAAGPPNAHRPEPISWRGLVALVREAGTGFVEDQAATRGAALAYYAVFALAPLLVIATAVAGAVFGEQAVQGHLSSQIQEFVGPDGARVVETMVANASRRQTTWFASAVGLAVLLVGAGGLFGQLQESLDKIWGVRPKAGRGWWAVIRDRFLSFTMVLGSAFLLLVSLVVSTALAALTRYLGDGAGSPVRQTANIAVSLLVVTLLFAMIYRFLPDAQIAWRDVWLGAAVTALLFTGGKYLIGLYLGHASTVSVFGAAGSLAALLVWLYYSAQIFLFGAELTWAFACRFGRGVVPADNAEPKPKG